MCKRVLRLLAAWLLGPACAVGLASVGLEEAPPLGPSVSLSANVAAIVCFPDEDADTVRDIAAIERYRSDEDGVMHEFLAIRDGRTLETLSRYHPRAGSLSNSISPGWYAREPVIAVATRLWRGFGCRSHIADHCLHVVDRSGTLVREWESIGLRYVQSLDYSGATRAGGAWLAAGALSSTVGGTHEAGVILVSAAADVEVLLRSDSSWCAARFAGDANGDGIDDIAVLYRARSYARDSRLVLHDGATLAVLWDVATVAGPGARLKRLADVTGDRLEDLAVSWPGAPDASSLQLAAGMVSVYSADDGCQLWSRSGDSGCGQFGWSLCVLPDQNGDGVEDLLCSNPDGFLAPDGPPNRDDSHVAILSGSTGAELSRLSPAVPGRGFGVAMAAQGGRVGSSEFVVSTYRWTDPARVRLSRYGRLVEPVPPEDAVQPPGRDH